MSLSDEQWDALQLVPTVARARADFFIDYANQAPFFEVDGLIRAFRDGPLGDDSDQPVIDVTDFDDDSGLAGVLRQRMAEAADRPRHGPWVRTAERADALRHAAQAALLYETDEGRDVLLQSASLYRELGLPFGSFLTAAATGPQDVAFAAGRLLRSFILSPGERAFPEADEERTLSLRQSLQAPAQQIAVLFTATASNDAIHEFRIDAGALRRAPQAARASAVGVTGLPVALWWECGVRLAELAYGRWAARDDLRTTIAELAAAHGQALRSAQYDQYHWSRAISRTDLVDLDLAGLTAVSNRLLRQLDEPEWSLSDDFPGLAPLSQISVQVGLDISGRGRPRSPGRAPAPSPDPLPSPPAASGYARTYQP